MMFTLVLALENSQFLNSLNTQNFAKFVMSLKSDITFNTL